MRLILWRVLEVSCERVGRDLQAWTDFSRLFLLSRCARLLERPQWWTAVFHYLIRDPATGELRKKVANRNQDWPTNLNESFHVYGLDWTAGQFIWTIDEVVMWRYNYSRLFTDPNNINVFDDGYYYIILDVAVGGRMFGIGYDKLPPYGELCEDANIFSATQIDWVRVYQEIGKNNYTFGPGPSIVAGSQIGIAEEGATCPFDGCIGSTWNNRVDRILGTTRTEAAAPTTKATTQKTTKARPTSTADAYEGVGVDTVSTTPRPSGAGLSAVMPALAVALALVAGVFVSFA